MTLSLGHLFSPTFDSEDAKISIGDFYSFGEKKTITYRSTEDFVELFFIFILGLIQPEYSQKYIDKTLTNDDTLDIKNTLSSTQFSNPRGQPGVIAETILRDYRSNTIVDNYLNDHIKKGISTTTHPGADLIEIIKEGEEFLILSRDARNNASDSPQEAITGKLIDLYSKKFKRTTTRKIIDGIEDLTSDDIIHLKTNIHRLRHKQIIFLFSKPGRPIKFGVSWLIERKSKNKPGESSIIDAMIRNGDYDQYRINCSIKNYESISREIVKYLFNSKSLERKLRSHAAV